MGQVQHPALAELEIRAEVLLEALPELQRVLVDGGRLVEQVVRADDRGVAGHVAAAEPSALEDRDVGDAVVLGQVVGGGQAVATAADDHDLVCGPGFGGAPVPFARVRRSPFPRVASSG